MANSLPTSGHNSPLMEGGSSSHRRARVSGVVIAYNRVELIETCLRALAFVDELLVIDKSSTDGTAERARALADRVIVVPWSPVVEHTREMAIQACTYDWIVCVDDDECLSVEAGKFIIDELLSPRAKVYLLPQRHYILGEHDERAYYWPEYQARFFRRDAVSFRNTVHGGTVYDEDDAFVVPFDTGVCIHHLSHKDVAQWIEKTNRYTSNLDRKRAPDAGNDIARFAHESIDRYVGASRDAVAGSYPQAVAVLRSLYDMIDRLKTWEEEEGRDGAREFQRICRNLDAQYARHLPKRERAGRFEVIDADRHGRSPVGCATHAPTAEQVDLEPAGRADAAVTGLRESIRLIRDAYEQNVAAARHRIGEIEVALRKELEAQQRYIDRLKDQGASDKRTQQMLIDRLKELEEQGASDKHQLSLCVDELTEHYQLANKKVVELDARCIQLNKELIFAKQNVEEIYKSHSWRVTAPLRASVDVLRAIKRVTYRESAAVARAMYRTLPLSQAQKNQLKDLLFTSTGRWLAGTGAYQRWHAAGQKPDKYARQGGAKNSSAVLVMSDVLPVADGVWEWASHTPTRARIDATLAVRRREQTITPRKVISLGNTDLREAAARIRLKPSSAAPDISVIVPVFNQLATTLECLLSIAETQTALDYEVIIANDASSDETAQILAAIPNLKVITQARNMGFLRNCNTVAQHALGRWIVFLNNDAQVSVGWLDALVRICRMPNVGAVGPRMVYPNGVLQEAGVRIKRNGSVEMIGLGENPDSPRWSYMREVDYVSGACLMLERSLFNDLGGFSDDLAPAYCEDLDLCLRVRERGLRVMYTPEAEVIHHLSKSSDSIGNTYKLGLIARNMQRLSERHQSTFDRLDDVRFIAFYLPQFHPTAENDFWWGKGFTEWLNVGKAQPNFVGHDQPRVPADLGYYDLRLREAMEAQWELASRYGIDGFCYYYYWFHGKRLLDQPLDRLRDPARPAHPFCLCWANENWTRRWDGQDQEVLMAQAHSPEDDLAVIRDLAQYMCHPNYIRVQGKPLLLIYRVDLFPNFVETAARWREECIRIGIGEIHLAMMESFRFAGLNVAPSEFGCDASVEFPAHYAPEPRPPKGAMLNANFHGRITGYDDAATLCATREHPGFIRYRTVMPGWDNTARRQDASSILEDPTPGSFQAWTETAVVETKRDLHGDNRLVFINAWNEWAEGAYLEPDRRLGHANLEAVSNARMAENLVRAKPAVN